MKRRRLELPRHNCHYPLKVARLPIPPSLRMIQKTFSVPRTGLEPARLSTLAPETSASTIPPPGQKMFLNILSGKRDSNSRPRPWQGRALPTELLPHKSFCKEHFSKCDAKVVLFCYTCKSFQVFFHKNIDFFYSSAHIRQCHLIILYKQQIRAYFARNRKILKLQVGNAQCEILSDDFRL